MTAEERESLRRIRSTFAAMGPNKWKVNVPGLLKEVLVNDKTEVFVSPFRILLSILKEVAERSLELNDEKLLELMLRLALIEPIEPSEETK